jgi:SAM-dependent methyltransferase
MNEPESTRKSVSDAYAETVTRPSESCCCGGTPAPKGVVSKLAGYTSDELEALPPEAVVNSFGCGNPLAFAEVTAGQTVLDLGSGAGIDLLLAGKKVGPTGRAIGVDMTDEMIAKARENIAGAGLTNVEVRKGIIEDLPVESDSVDWVISNCVINLSPEKHRVFAELARVLKPGGRVAVSDIVVRDLPDWARKNERLYSSCIAGAITEEEYLEGLRQAGLTDVEVRERLVYDNAQLREFIKSELPESDEASSCCGASLDEQTAQQLADVMVGKIWSAKFHARKPS